jgi:hypothetical protein
MGELIHIDVMLENALFEEEQLQVNKARKIYESIQNDIAPDYLKSLTLFINFEKRQNNIEKVKELYFKAYTSALKSNDVDTLSYILVQYARFLTFRCEDPNRAFDVLNSTIGKAKPSKVLYLNVVNLIKHLEGRMVDVYSKVCAIFEKATDEDSGLS